MCALVETRVISNANLTPQQIVQEMYNTTGSKTNTEDAFFETWRKKMRIDEQQQQAGKNLIQQETLSEPIIQQKDNDLNIINNLHAATHEQEQQQRATIRQARNSSLIRDPTKQSIFSMDTYKRQNLTERSTRRFWERLFDWIEQTSIYQTVYYYAKQYGTRKPGYVPHYSGYQPQYNDYSYNNYNNYRLSRTEQFIRYLVDKYIELRDSFGYSNSNNSNNSDMDDKRIANDIAARMDRFLMGRQMMYHRGYYAQQQQPQRKYGWADWFWDSLNRFLFFIKQFFPS